MAQKVQRGSLSILDKKNLDEYQYRNKKAVKLVIVVEGDQKAPIDPGGRVFANGPREMGSIPGRVIPKTLKMVLDTSLLNTQHYYVRINGKEEQSRERSIALHYTSV